MTVTALRRHRLLRSRGEIAPRPLPNVVVRRHVVYVTLVGILSAVAQLGVGDGLHGIVF